MQQRASTCARAATDATLPKTLQQAGSRIYILRCPTGIARSRIPCFDQLCYDAFDLLSWCVGGFARQCVHKQAGEVKTQAHVRRSPTDNPTTR